MNHMKSPKIKPELALEMYRHAFTARTLDHTQTLLKRTGKSYFQIFGAGHEVIQIALAPFLRPGVDFIAPYYRDLALTLAYGLTPYEVLLMAVGAAEDRASGGRQMPHHWGHSELKIWSAASAVGTQFCPAVGYALGAKIAAADSEIAARIDGFDPEGIALVFGGDGSTSEGDFMESVNYACVKRAPVLFVIEDDGYAISTPVREQTAGGSIVNLVSGLAQAKDDEGAPLLKVTGEIDGCDFQASHAAAREAVEYVRTHRKPALLHAHVTRPLGHSESDDGKSYRTVVERDREASRDPVKMMREWVISELGVAESKIEKLETAAEKEVAEARQRAEATTKQTRESLFDHVFASDNATTSASLAVVVDETYSDQAPKTIKQALNLLMHEEFARDPRLITFGEDVADCGKSEVLLPAESTQKDPWNWTQKDRAEHLQDLPGKDKVYGKGGVFGVTVDLQKRFGAHRCFNTPLAESLIVGTAIGLAVRGLRPIPEIQFCDYIWPAMEAIRTNLSTLRWRSAGDFQAPVVIRTTSGGYLRGSGALNHSQSIEGTFAHFPGIYIVIPSTVHDAVGLMKTALRHAEDPVLFIEEKILYNDPSLAAPYPGKDYTVPFGVARKDFEGDKLTVVSWGITAVLCRRVLADNFSGAVDFIDLRTIMPWDKQCVFSSVEKTGSLLVVHGDARTMGFGAEIVAEVTEKCFYSLEKPPERLCALDLPVSYGPAESWILPQEEDIKRKIGESLES
ncbi:MAG: thiamine pyrophosphate-dependent enzyme [Candidatus Zixiibacteriota bacterium]